jgi:hypothetical protein
VQTEGTENGIPRGLGFLLDFLMNRVSCRLFEA